MLDTIVGAEISEEIQAKLNAGKDVGLDALAHDLDSLACEAREARDKVRKKREEDRKRTGWELWIIPANPDREPFLSSWNGDRRLNIAGMTLEQVQDFIASRPFSKTYEIRKRVKSR